VTNSDRKLFRDIGDGIADVGRHLARAGERLREGAGQMSYRGMVMDIGVMIAIAGSLSGCAGRARVSTKSMCEAHGGSYSATAKQCTDTAQPSARSAAQICQMQGGQLDPVSDECAIDDRSK
jgi:hypothetical protein